MGESHSEVGPTVGGLVTDERTLFFGYIRRIFGSDVSMYQAAMVAR
jgi:hypothetical protein